MRTPQSEQGYHFRGSDLWLYLHVQPRSSKAGWAGPYQNRLKLKVNSPPVDGQANQACIEFLAKFLSVSKSEIEIVEGLTSRQKTICVKHFPPERWQQLFSKIVP